MRTHLLSTVAAAALLAATSAHAQDATWLLNPAREVSTRPATGTRRWCRPIPRSSARRIQPQHYSNPSQRRRSQRCSSTPMRLPIVSLHLKASSHQSASPVPASSTILPTHRLLSSATRRTFFFRGASTAGNATIITNPGGLTGFVDSATGGNARFIILAGGAFHMSSLSTGRMTAGSIEGAGTFSLGPNQLIVGSNNLSTTEGGVITGTGGSLVKVGSGTLTLAGTNSYTGATVVTGGTLAVTGDISSSSG